MSDDGDPGEFLDAEDPVTGSVLGVDDEPDDEATQEMRPLFPSGPDPELEAAWAELFDDSPPPEGA